MTTPAGRPPGRKTYTRLAAGRRVPLEYELVSTDLHYNHPMRFELPAANPVVAWYYRYREGSALRARDWERFSDPRRTTYRAYTVLQDGREDVIDGLLREVDDTGYDRNLDQEWVRFLDRWYSPLRFPVHGLQMLAAYVAQMAPASRITNCAAFQSADELRRVQRIAYRTVQLSGPPFGIGTARHQAAWEGAEAFQPLRELIERALVAYDWGEAFTVTNLVIKPRIDRLVNQEIAGTLATANGDPILASIHFSLDEDARWHRAWTMALLRYLIDDTPVNAEVVSGWIGKWSPLASRALEAFAGTLAEAPVPLDASAVTARITSDVSRDTDSALTAPPASAVPDTGRAGTDG
jgi:toluene monooxygenase system protein E